MNSQEEFGSVHRTSQEQGEIEEVADRFEQDWNSGIELGPYLNCVPAELRPRLERILRDIDWQKRTQVPGRFGKYDLEAELGKGAFGTVFRAFEIETLRPVALKILLPERSRLDAERERFVREARLASKLDHPHIVKVYEAVAWDGLPYIAFQLIQGRNLAKWLNDHRPEPIESVKLLLPVIDAMRAAHSAELVHRDLKPANILIDKTGKAYVTDFGMAATDAEMIAGEQAGFAGTLAYMAPEQLADKGYRVGERTDLFALGVILYEMLTSRHPWSFPWKRGAELQQLPEYLRHVSEYPPKYPCNYNQNVSDALANVCLKALAPDPAQRYAGCGQFGEELRRAAGLAPTERVLPTSAIQELLRRIKPGPAVDRNRIGSSFVAACARAVSNYDDAVTIVRRAGEVLREVHPRSTVVEAIHLPAATAPILRFWSAAFDEACLHGPRMVAVLLLVFPQGRIPLELRLQPDDLF